MYIGLLDTTKKTDLIKDALREGERFSLELDRFIEGSSERIQWLELDLNQELTLSDVALDIRPQLADLFTRAISVTLTSATLTTNSNFSYIKTRLGIENAEEFKLGSSINYRDNMLIYIVENGPPPNDALAFDSFTSRSLIKATKLLNGRVLGLFTSHKNIKGTYYKSLKSLNKENIKLLAQRITGGRHNIAERFTKDPHTILLGTYSFWEGVDVPGDSLSCVLIPRLPFQPPKDPVTDAIAEAENLNGFRDISLPQTILKIRQGVGRLLRSPTDHGAVIFLDPRLTSTNYSDTILKSLPPATIKIGSEADLVPALTDWFGEEKLTEWKTTTSP